jgi:hypothetical protein
MKRITRSTLTLALATLTFGISATVHAQVPAGPTAFWQFNEPSGAVVLDSVGGNNGTINGAGITRISGAPGMGGALNFSNGSADQVTFGNSLFATNGITLEALIRPNWTAVPGDYDEIFRKEDGSNRILLSFQNDGNSNGFAFPSPGGPQGPVLSFGLGVGGIYTELDMPLDGLAGRPTVAGLNDGNWHHVVAMYDSLTGIKQIAIDGTVRSSANYTPGSLINSGGSGAAVIGNFPGGGEPFNGGIDEVAFYGRALSTTEIANHYNNVQSGVGYFGTASATAPEPGSFALVLPLAIPLMRRAMRRRSRAL